MDANVGIEAAKWYTTQAGVAAATLGFVAVAEGLAIWALFRFFVTNFRNDIKEAFAAVSAMSGARHEDCEKTQNALSVNTIALARLSERLDLTDRREGRR